MIILVSCQSITNEAPNEAEVNPACQLLADTKKKKHAWSVCTHLAPQEGDHGLQEMYPGVRSPISSHMILEMRWLRTPSKPT
jgi:hypothetical protein